jgi:hypothetical protein
LRNRVSLCIAFVVLFALSLGAQELVPARLMIDQANAQLAATGSSLRIVKASFFMRGMGTPDYRHLRTGTKWPFRTVTYIVDGSDMTVDVPAAGASAAIVNAYNTWNAVQNTDITAVQVSDDGSNFDVLDGTFHPVTGQCLSLFDVTSPNLDLSSGQIFPAADIVVGGWLKPQYFSSCLGSSSILGVTWTFADGDVNSDHYTDTLYVEQFYNEGFSWVLNGSTFLGPTEDIQSIVLHENGHALGLDHMGGPNPNEPFKLQPNGKVFDPEAVMNPFYLGGEKRSPFPTDVAGLRTLYANHSH